MQPLYSITSTTTLLSAAALFTLFISLSKIWGTMLYPTPVSLLCTLLLCLPLAVVFTITTPITTPITTTSPTTKAAADTAIPTIPTTNTNRIAQLTLPRLEKQGKTINRTEPESDDPLFRLAARVNPVPTRPKKLAFMFLTTTPLHLSPIWELFFNRTPKKLYNVYIHADPRFAYDPPFTGVFRNRVIPDSKPTSRHSPTLVSAARRLLSHALLHDPANSMFALLSPSCIPLHSFEFTYRVLTRSRKSFIEILNDEIGAYDRWAARGEETMLPVLPFSDFRIGSQFFVVTRRHARVIVSDRRLWSKFKLPCLEESTCYPEEHYFPTLLNLKDPRGCVPATLTHVDWRESYDGHPKTYDVSEVVPELILGLRKQRPRYGDEDVNGTDSTVRRKRHPFLFARKFSPESVEPLLEMVGDVILKD